MIPLPRPGSLSFVIPVYNERESLSALHTEIVAAASGLDDQFEILFIDDGSNDGSWDAISTLATQDHRVQGHRFRRNFGKAAALAAGFTLARHETVFTLDADLQDDPAEVPRFLAALAEGKDVISGWKQVRHDPWHKVFPSRIFNGMVSKLTGVKLHDHNCGFKAYRLPVVKDVSLYGELHRFVPVLADALGYRVGEIAIHHRARKFGRSKFGARRFLKGFLDLISVSARTTFGYRPMHLLGTTALIVFLLATFFYFLSFWFTGTYIFALVGWVLAGQALLTGLVAEMTLGQNPPPAPYAISQRTPSHTTTQD